MSLYGDLPSAKDDDAGGKGWVASAQKLQPTWKKPSNVLAPPSVTRSGRGPAGGGRTPTAAAGRGGGRGPPPASLPAAAANIVNIHASTTPQQQQHHSQQRGSTFSFFTAANGEQLQDEYDPSKPNDFEELLKQRQAKQRAAEEEAERLARLREVQQEIERRKQEQAEAAAFIAAASRPPPGSETNNQQQQQDTKPEADPDAEFAYQGPTGGLGSSSSNAAAAAAAAAGLGSSSSSNAASGDIKMGDAEMDDYERERQRRLKMSGEDAFRARGRMGGAGPPPSSSSSGSFGGLPGLSGPPAAAAAAAAAAAPPFMQQQQQQGGGGGKGMGLAQKLLEKMGWREGQGLGRHRQGMATPLVAQKTAANAGVIVNAEQPGDKRARTGSQFVGVPCRVVVLRNMVGPGEVDEDLEEEVGTELTKYGTVTDVMIFEVTTPGYAPEEAVRIFVQFDRTEAATRALVDLQGRFFGGRQVRAAFFSEERFEKQQLAPQAGEFGEGS